MRRLDTVSRPDGFSLVEVMVALIIICVGLLGIAKLQALMLSNTGASRMRALAALEASSIAATMHADRDYWAGTPALTTTVNDTVAGKGVTSSDSNLQTTPDCTAAPDAPCTPVKLAAYDLQNWLNDMYVTLPASTSQILCAPGIVVSCTITITWQENTVASNSQEAATNPFQTQTYQLVVNP
ncbi:MAG TPA: type IV pilus modification protein PilV [Propionibacteriaceae bacterium]|nr:type IV pilus modification protein PilV [Propionibacteriaceae bacterium]